MVHRWLPFVYAHWTPIRKKYFSFMQKFYGWKEIILFLWIYNNAEKNKNALFVFMRYQFERLSHFYIHLNYLHFLQSVFGMKLHMRDIVQIQIGFTNKNHMFVPSQWDCRGDIGMALAACLYVCPFVCHNLRFPCILHKRPMGLSSNFMGEHTLWDFPCVILVTLLNSHRHLVSVWSSNCRGL